MRREGFSLVSALFILIVVAAAGAAALRLVGAERRTSSLGLLAARAHQAARAGLEWGVAKVVATPTACPAGGSFTLAGGSLSGFDVTVTCSLGAHPEGANTTNVFVITAFARRGSFGAADYASRRLEATVAVQP
jgi:MSHA biogenesis protein MshP